MKATLKNIKIENFKGISHLEMEFNPTMTEIVGDNATGKTSLLDAYLWVLTGVDSAGNGKFKVQPVDENNNIIPKLTTRVELVMDISEIEHTIVKELHQSWTKDDKFKGSSAKYYIDDVPYKEGDYNKKIAELLCDVKNFTLLSSLGAFLSLDMRERRAKLMEMAGDVEDISGQYPNVAAELAKGKSIEDMIIQYNHRIKDLNEKQQDIPVRISENEKDMPTADFDVLRAEEKKIEQRISEIDGILAQGSQARAVLFQEHQKKIDALNNLKTQLNEVVMSLSEQRRNKINSLNESLYELKNQKMTKELKAKEVSNLIIFNEAEVERLGRELSNLRNQWKEINARQFNGKTDKECPTCHKPFTEEEMTVALNAMVEAFNKSKVSALELVTSSGNELSAKRKDIVLTTSALKNDLEVINKELADITKQMSNIQSEIDSVPTVDALKAASKEYAKINAQVEEMQVEVFQHSDKSEDAEDQLLQEKKVLQANLKDVVTLLAQEQNIAKIKARTEELLKEGKAIAEQLAQQQALLMEVKEYKSHYISLVNDKVSQLFQIVKFQMYEQNTSNDGVKEMCECLVGGVPYTTNLNDGARINAELDIINALSSWLDLSVPVFIDNKERVTSLLPMGNSQVITLSVVAKESLKKLS